MDIIDTTVLIHVMRGNPAAQNWLASDVKGKIGVTSISWMELLQGANSAPSKRRAMTLLSAFPIVYLEHQDQKWAIERFHALGNAIGLNDCLIAAVASRTGGRLYTHNTGHMGRMLPSYKVIRPYGG